MSRSPSRYSIRCAEPGCTEQTMVEQRSQRDIRRHGLRAPWKCLKHSRPGEWLTVVNAKRETVVTARKLPNCGDHLFWLPEGEAHGSGFMSGPGFMASTSEFPEGTQLRVTVEVVLP